MHRRFLSAKWRSLVLLAGLGVMLTGCAGRPTLDGWQRDFESYVRTQANGDLNAMRGLVADEGRATFAVYGKADPDKSRDVAGLWLGPVAAAGERWQVFLVSVVDRRQIEAVRLLAVRRGLGGQWRWCLSKRDAQAERTYRQALLRRSARPGRPNTGEDAASLVRWPTPGDDFAVQRDGARLRVVERQSGAQWQLSLGSTLAADAENP
jgi:hypothetical protein